MRESRPSEGVGNSRRLQVNIRLTEAERARMEELRRRRTPIPSMSKLLLELADAAYEREIGSKGDGRKAKV